ncbi:PEP-CTERM sorting domain-containing protein [Akkermansiaceae bacterium]|nr:PEP-CTERM sorting domain-containing protein [Akkermansiaceae bacterium]MDB4615091.1 PEP-CTERM sorting domain-containing protein [Akkermansiaceae bacterium]MDC0275050.1 PEP-CTERM sorting domain-containing protein [Akkermansiaceae bacterium]
MKKTIINTKAIIASVAGLSALGTASSSAAIVIAGLDDFDSTTAPTVGVLAADITATASASAVGGIANWSLEGGGNAGRGSSKDSTWGTFAGPASASTVTTTVGANLALLNGATDGQLTITITNNGSSSYALENFHFDAVAFRPNAARAYALNVLAGSNVTVGNVFTSADDAITHLGGGLLTDDTDPLTHDQHDDIDISLLGLTDNILDAGEQAILQIEFTSGTGSGGGHHLFLDNIAVSGDVVPEPSSALLALVSGGLLLRRRRK